MDLPSELIRLVELHREGALTEEEFRAAKAQLLSGQAAQPESGELAEADRLELDLLRHKEREAALREREERLADQHESDVGCIWSSIKLVLLCAFYIAIALFMKAFFDDLKR